MTKWNANSLSNFDFVGPKSRLLKRMLTIPGFFINNLRDGGYQRANGTYPFHMDFKQTLLYPEIRVQIARSMGDLITGSRSKCIIGVEAGGVQYASNMADNLLLPFIIARTNPKEGKIFTANIPQGEGNIVLVDDVVATGTTIKPIVDDLHKNGHKNIEIVTTMSWGIDQLLSDKFGTTIRSLYQVEDLIRLLSKEYPVVELRQAVIAKRKSLLDA